MLGKSFLRTEFVSLTMSLPTVIGIIGSSVGICLICQRKRHMPRETHSK